MLNGHFGKFFSDELASGTEQGRDSAVMGLTHGTMALACGAVVRGHGQLRQTAQAWEHGVAAHEGTTGSRQSRGAWKCDNDQRGHCRGDHESVAAGDGTCEEGVGRSDTQRWRQWAMRRHRRDLGVVVAEAQDGGDRGGGMV